MAGRTEHEAVTNYLEPLHRTISCITQTVLNNFGGYRAGVTHTLTTYEDPIHLRGTGGDLGLSLIQSYRIVETTDSERGPWKVTIISYSYTVKDGERREILAYHWHPHTSTVTSPHIHLSVAAGVERPELQTAHIPTGRVAIESVFRLLISDFGVPPRREDWQDVLAETQGRFEMYRTWS